MKALFCFLLISFLSVQFSYAAEVENIQENIRIMGFDKYYRDLKLEKNKRQVKVAIFDYGFQGYESEKGSTIPGNTIYKQRPGDTQVNDPRDQNTHGLVMAQILTQYMTANYERWSFAPKIYLYKSNGYTNFQWAINDAIKNGVDVILHSIVIEYGSNYDGKGFFNDLVNQATDAGIVWVNAAGNFGQTTFNSNVNVGNNSWVDLDLENNALPVKCAFPKEAKVKPQNRKCNIRVVLSWDDFKNKPQEGTTKDLDLYLTDENFEKTTASELRQVAMNDSNQGKLGYTLYPREIIETQIPEGTSYIKVKSITDNFATSDKLRITAEGDYVRFPERDKQESLLNPADNPNVITVGEKSSKSSVSRSLNKPELVAPSLVKGDDGQRYKGSSNAAAVVAAGIALMKKINPDLDRESILELASSDASIEDIYNYPSQPRGPIPVPFKPRYAPPELNSTTFIQSGRKASVHELETVTVNGSDEQEYEERRTPHRAEAQNPYSIPTRLLGFGRPRGVGCYPLADIKRVEPCMVADFIIKSQSLLVSTSVGLKIATSYDPIKLIPGDARLDMRDKVVVVPSEGFVFRRVPRNMPLPRGAIEIFKMPVDDIICKLPDWDFLMTEMEVSRRRVYANNQVGAYNRYIPQSCSPGMLSKKRYPVSNWGMYPILQQSPYMSPIGPAQVDTRYNQSSEDYDDYSDDDEGYRTPQRRPKKSGSEEFRLPSPSNVRE